MSAIAAASAVRIDRTGAFHTGTGLLSWLLIAGLRMMKYQSRPYDELLTTVAAIVQPSDSLISAAPAIGQKPMRGRMNSISIKGKTPFGTSRRPRTRVVPAMTIAPQGT